MASARLARVLWDAVFGKGAWDNAERCNAHRELRIRWIAAITPFCKAPAETGAQVNRQMLMDAWEAGWDAINRGVGAFDPAKYADSINFAPERTPLPYSAKEVTDAVLSAWCNPHGVPPQPGRIDPYGYKAAIAAAKRFCAPPAEPKTATITAHFTADSQQYPAPSGFSAMLTDPTLDEIRARAAKHGMVLIEADLSARPPGKWYWEDRTPASLTAPLPAPDARFGGGK